MESRIAQACVCCGNTELKSSPAILMPFISHRTFGWSPVEINENWGLKTIKSGMAYSICKSMLCTNCEHLFLDIRFTADELANLYRGYRGKEYVELRDFYEPGYKKKNDSLDVGYNYLDKIESFLKPFLPTKPAVLDWGGDSGINTPFKSANSALHIFDISEREVVSGAKSVSKAQTRETNYDLVVCSNDLEHIPYPSEVLQDMRLSMKAHTVLYIEVPFENLVRTTTDKSALNTAKKHWHEHINFYNERSLSELLTKNGFKILSLRALPITGETSDYVFQIACTVQ